MRRPFGRKGGFMQYCLACPAAAVEPIRWAIVIEGECFMNNEPKKQLEAFGIGAMVSFFAIVFFFQEFFPNIRSIPIGVWVPLVIIGGVIGVAVGNRINK
jgi:hypothetical protein